MALLGNAASVYAELARRRTVFDVVTDQTSAHDPLGGYIPEGVTAEEAPQLRKQEPQDYVKRAKASIVRHCEAMVALRRLGSVVFDYGNNLRGQAKAAVWDQAQPHLQAAVASDSLHLGVAGRAGRERVTEQAEEEAERPRVEHVQVGQQRRPAGAQPPSCLGGLRGLVLGLAAQQFLGECLAAFNLRRLPCRSEDTQPVTPELVDDAACERQLRSDARLRPARGLQPAPTGGVHASEPRGCARPARFPTRPRCPRSRTGAARGTGRTPPATAGEPPCRPVPQRTTGRAQRSPPTCPTGLSAAR